jgi:hypothetical protein
MIVKDQIYATLKYDQIQCKLIKNQDVENVRNSRTMLPSLLKKIN